MFYIAETHKAPKQQTPIRLQEYGIGIFETKPTKSSFKKAVKNGLVFVNGTKATTALFIKGGEVIELYKREETRKPFNLELQILFEDDYLAVIHKPAGINVSGNSFATIDNALSQNLELSSKKDAVRPRPVHRLDYPTSGLLLVGKTTSSIISLNKLFENKEIQKTYYAITIGKMQSKGKIDIDIDNKKAITKFEIEQTVISERFEFLNLVKLYPKTGRKHQLRKHLLHIGNPILGDKEYFCQGKILNGKGLFLNAYSLEFTHPFTLEKLKITGTHPKKFKKIFNCI